MAQFTKKAIMDSFMKLLDNKPLDKITVKDIIEDCDINRGTFYYYYSDIYALVENIFETELQEVLSDNTLYTSWQNGFLAATQLAKKEKRQLYHAYDFISREKLEKYLYGVADHFMKKFVDDQSKGLEVSDTDKQVICSFYVCALVGLITQWIDRGMKEDPDIYINRIGLLFEGNIRKALERAAGIQTVK